MMESIGYPRLEFSGSMFDSESRYTTQALQTSGKQQDYSLLELRKFYFMRSWNWWTIIDEEQPYSDCEAILERNSKTESKPEEFGASVFTPTLWIAMSSY